MPIDWWAGSARESLDLHLLVGGDWDASMIRCARVVDHRLLLLGTVEKHQQNGGYTMLVGERACVWEYALS